MKIVPCISAFVLAMLLSACKPQEASVSGGYIDAEASAAPYMENAPVPTALENVTEQVARAARDQLKESTEQFKSLYSSVDLRAEDDRTIVFTYTYARPTEDLDETRKSLEGLFEDMRPMAEALADTMRSAGVDDPAVRFEYLDADGALITATEYR